MNIFYGLALLTAVMYTVLWVLNVTTDYPTETKKEKEARNKYNREVREINQKSTEYERQDGRR